MLFFHPHAASEDFNGDEIIVLIPAGPTPQIGCFNSTFITDDDVVEGTESLRVEVVETSLAEYVFFGPLSVDVTITDYDGRNSFMQ